MSEAKICNNVDPDELIIACSPYDNKEDVPAYDALESDEFHIDNLIEEDMGFDTSIDHIDMHTCISIGSEEYHCKQCDINYDSLQAFATAHGQGLDTIEYFGEVLSPIYKSEDEQIKAVTSNLTVESDLKTLTMNPMDAGFIDLAGALHSEILNTGFVLNKQIHLKEQNHANNDDDENDTDENENDDTKKYFCNDCNALYDDYKSAANHECHKSLANRSMHKQKFKIKVASAKCEICNTIFPNAKNLKFHMRMHDKRPGKSIQDALPANAVDEYNELAQFYCEICKKYFDTSLLEVHKNMHQSFSDHVCGICNRNFDNIACYEMHLKIHVDKPQTRSQRKINKNTGKNVYPCQYCSHTFSRPYEKVKHERVHTGEKPYSCEVCGKCFRVCYSLTLHLRTHTNIRPFTCTTCKKSFKSQQVYTHHLRTHDAVRTFNCDICNKSFRTSVQLHSHKNSHIKPFNCPECNRPFSSLYGVKIHMKTHSRKARNCNGEYGIIANSKNDLLPFACTICGAQYSRLNPLRAHMANVHKKKLRTEDESDSDVQIAGNIDTGAALYFTDSEVRSPYTSIADYGFDETDSANDIVEEVVPHDNEFDEQHLTSIGDWAPL